MACREPESCVPTWLQGLLRWVEPSSQSYIYSDSHTSRNSNVYLSKIRRNRYIEEVVCTLLFRLWLLIQRSFK